VIAGAIGGAAWLRSSKMSFGRLTLLWRRGALRLNRMSTVDFSDDEHAAVTDAVRRTIAEDRYPLSPRLAPLKSALAKLDPASVPKPLAEHKPLPEAPMRSRGGSTSLVFKLIA
jgi:hypothetical protein